MSKNAQTGEEESCSSSSLSTHALHMRAALDDCSGLVERLCKLLHLDNTDLCDPTTTRQLSMDNYGAIQQLFHSAWLESNEIEQEREIGQRSMQDVSFSKLDVLHVEKNGWYREDDTTGNRLLTTSDFKRKYCIRNVPCIIRGLDQLNFKDVSFNWTMTDTTSSPSNESRINTEWFERHVGPDTMVPVRIDQRNELDEDGRAEECETMMMSLKDWITSCQEKISNGEETSTEYLKDWHLVQLMKSKRSGTCDVATNDAKSRFPLYNTPEYFKNDILNNFLERYSDGGDFMFTYWGPRGSMTSVHSDVLHSFSWSYNVTGAKKWTFYTENGDNNSSSCRSFEVIQNTGDTIFVSSKIKHEVVNIVETLSINHNWITSANIHNTWQCICSEIIAIEKELKDWGVPMDDFEARENMLRGCIGMDVTMFILMILVEILELLVRAISTVKETVEDDNEYNDHALSIYMLVKVLSEVSNCEEAKSAQRLQAVLHSKARATQADELTVFVMDLTNVLRKPFSI